MTATLADIRLSFRRLTAQYQSTQITDSQIDKYVNTYYLYDLPEELRLLQLKTNWTLTTTPNVEYYNMLQTEYTTLQPPVYCSGYRIGYFQSQAEFYNIWPQFNAEQDEALGNGTAGPFTINLVDTPVLASRLDANGARQNVGVIVSARVGAGETGATLIARDNGLGGFDGDVLPGALIDYTTGIISNFSFNSAIASGNSVNVKYVPYQPSRPSSVLFFRNQLIFRPVPDDVYNVTVEAFALPTTLAASGDEPELRQWWQLLAYGGAYKYFAEFKDTDNIQYMKALLDEQLCLAERRTIKQISTQQVATIYNVRGYGRGRGSYYLPGIGGP